MRTEVKTSVSVLVLEVQLKLSTIENVQDERFIIVVSHFQGSGKTH